MESVKSSTQDSGSDLNGTSETQEERLKMDGSTEPPTGGLYQKTTNENKPNITIESISSYGIEGIFTTPENLSLRPASHSPEEGEDHRISASFLAQISGQDIETITTWARKGQFFVKLEFHITENELPQFSVRAIVVEHQDNDISLSGGLGFAIRLLNFVKKLNSETPVASQRRRFPIPRRKTLPEGRRIGPERHWRTLGPGSQPRPLHLRDLEKLSRFPQHQGTWLESKSLPSPFTSSLPSLDDPEDDQFSVSTDYTVDSMEMPPLTTATTASNSWFDDNSNYYGFSGSPPDEALETDVPLFGQADDLAPCPEKGHQVLCDKFEQEKRDAVDMYARTGDTSGMVSLMLQATASRSFYSHNLFQGPAGS